MNLAPISLFYWIGTENFGDYLSRDVVAHVSGRQVEQAGNLEADLFAIGSIFQSVVQGGRGRAKEDRPLVWGSGLMSTARRYDPEAQQIFSLRGPLTRAILDLPPLPYGDPGLLAADLLAQRPAPTGKIGILVHFSQKLSRALRAELAADPRFVMINLRTSDVFGVLTQIAACDHIVSSSLHGLIVADSFGIPNTWLDSTGIHPSHEFKFHDYALGVRRLLNLPIRPEQIIAAADSGLFGGGELPYMAEVEKTKAAIREAFPHEAVAERAERRMKARA